MPLTPEEEAAHEAWLHGEDTDADRDLLHNAAEDAGDWLPGPGLMSDDARAALDELGDPSGWGDVHVQFHEDMTADITTEAGNVTIDQADAQTVLGLLGGDIDVADDMDPWDEWIDEEHDIDVEGYGE